MRVLGTNDSVPVNHYSGVDHANSLLVQARGFSDRRNRGLVRTFGMLVRQIGALGQPQPDVPRAARALVHEPGTLRGEARAVSHAAGAPNMEHGPAEQAEDPPVDF